MRDVLVHGSGDLGALHEGLVGRIDQLESILSEVTARTGRASGEVAGQVEALRGVTDGALKQAGDLVASLDERGRSLAESTREQLRALAEATGTLEQVEARMGAALGERRQALEGLLARIGERSNELEGVTTAFTRLVEDLLRNAEAKARQIGAVLANSAEATTSAIGEQFERVRSTTGEESARTAASLRQAYEEVINQMGEALGAATGRFRDAAGELRTMSAQIQHELEATRAEVRRGAIELPQETEEAAANMRRVVADQIKALNELSALVSRSSRAVDAAPPAPPRRVSEPAAGIAAELRPTQGPRLRLRLRRASPKRRRRRRRRAGPSRRGETPPPAPPPRPPVRAAEPAPEARAGSEQGWLSNLLTRASQDEEAEDAAARAGAPERAPAEALNSLDAISVDIARMIDHQAVVDLWDRYSHGERNVFTRGLYTVQGQQTFDEIRRKYRRDQPFKQTVDRYVGEFERLIAEVGRNDRDRTLARTYLTSETGKVYTMLAHASGRFD